ncbi:MAG: ATP-binding protein, partial [Leptolyngbyaceae bacterium]|nr:ATP-binding protein [Leptolyngbyaceae bacterium]
VTLIGDKDKLKQVFINLIDNACEAIAEGETITWTISPDLSTYQVTLGIHNSGNPIPPDLLPRLSKPFYTTKSTGTGLGLAIAKRIVQAHDGDLLITSSAETGTIVSVRLPILPQSLRL